MGNESWKKRRKEEKGERPWKKRQGLGGNNGECGRGRIREGRGSGRTKEKEGKGGWRRCVEKWKWKLNNVGKGIEEMVDGEDKRRERIRREGERGRRNGRKRREGRENGRKREREG